MNNVIPFTGEFHIKNTCPCPLCVRASTIKLRDSLAERCQSIDDYLAEKGYEDDPRVLEDPR